MATSMSELQFSSESLELRDRIQELLGSRLRSLAIERARSHKNRLVTSEDVRACLPDAWKQVLEELGLELHGAQRSQ
ncbi:MAG: hypothetical protein WD278_05660 [Pirellulales bacterium]